MYKIDSSVAINGALNVQGVDVVDVLVKLVAHNNNLTKIVNDMLDREAERESSNDVIKNGKVM